MAIVLLIIYILILVFLIVNFVKCLKNKVKWQRIFIFEITSIILSAIIMMFYDNLPGSGFMPGLTYIGEVLVSFVAMIIYIITLAITAITKLLMYLLKKKEEGKNYFPKITIIIAIVLSIYGINALIFDLKNDINVGKTYATIVGYTENEYGYKRPIVEYSVGNKTYEVMIKVLNTEIQNSSLNDTIEIYYNKKQPAELAYLSYSETVYIPCFLISLLLFIVSSKNLKK